MTLQEETKASIWNLTGSPLTMFIFISSVYFSFWTGLLKGLNIIANSFSVCDGMTSFMGIILNAFSLFSSHFTSAAAFPPLNSRNFWVTLISTLSFSNLSLRYTNLFKLFWSSNLTKIISAKTLTLKECL